MAVLIIIFLISLHIQLLFLLVVFSRLLYAKKKINTSYTPGVSVIVAAHNELFNLKNLLPELFRQHYPNFEIIVVDDRSTDGTREYLREASASEDRLKVIHLEDFDPFYNPKKYALTQAIRLAEKEIVLLTDADCLPRSVNWIREMASGFNPKVQIVLGYSPYFKRKGLLNLLIRFETLYTGIQYLSLALSGKPYMGVGRNMAYRRDLFLSVNGFTPHESITGGDDDLFVQKTADARNTNVLFHSDAQTVSIPKIYLKDWLRQKHRHLSVGKHYQFQYRFLLGLLTLTHLVFYSCFFILLFSPTFYWLAIAGFLARTTAQIVIFKIISKKLRDNIPAISLPLLDFLYILNYLVSGLKAVVSPKSTWK